MAQNKTETENNQPQFSLQRIYTKDISFESPKAPDLFKEQWTPQVKLDLNTTHTKLDEPSMYEVVLSITATVNSEKKVAFVAEVKQAGIFFIENIPEQNIGHTLGAFCPNILFPYARETIDSLVTRGSFPPIMLAPVNFDAIYEQVKEKELAEKNTSSTLQ